MNGRLRPALRVATITTFAVAVVYAVIVTGILLLVSNRLVHETDARLRAQLRESAPAPATSSPTPSTSRGAVGDKDDAPVYVWRITASGDVAAENVGAPSLPSRLLATTGSFPRTVFFAGSDFRVDEQALGDGSGLVAAESLAQEHHVRSLLLTNALLVSPFLLAAVFGSAFVIGREASKPVERARQRQLEFTADASHELRTPLTVIEAEVGLALNTDRSAASYRQALQRVSGETHRLRRIVEDLLWLARFDSEPPPPQTELVDVATAAQLCADRFVAVARSRNIELDVETPTEEPAPITAAPEWVDRLIGVLLDNAIRYASSPGHVVLRVETAEGHVALTVDDDGPGIPFDERARLFDRFRRLAESSGEGAGLGLAIADAVVRTTHGRWTVGDSALGGASMGVTWRSPRTHTSPKLSASPH